MSRIDEAFGRLREEGRLGLIVYLTVGYPSLEQTPILVQAAATAGADMIELGIPFSDPLADGRTIQASSQAALRGGASVARALQAAAASRARTEIPLFFMTYLNPILSFGLERFCQAAKEAGVDGLIVPDLPPSESAALAGLAGHAGLGLVFFVAPTTQEAGIRAAAAASTAFVYCIAVTGVTGARQDMDSAVLPLVASVRRYTKLPVVVGFGISRPEHLRALQGSADGAIVASALLDAIGRAPQDAAAQVSRFISELRAGALS